MEGVSATPHQSMQDGRVGGGESEGSKPIAPDDEDMFDGRDGGGSIARGDGKQDKEDQGRET
jgi:hypothetical protein